MKKKEFEKYKHYKTRKIGSGSMVVVLLVGTFSIMGLSLLLLELIDKDIQYPIILRFIIGLGPGLGVMFYIQHRQKKRGSRSLVDVEIDCIRDSVKPHIKGDYETDVLNRLHSEYRKQSPLGNAEYYFEHSKQSGIALYHFQSLSLDQLTVFLQSEVVHYYDKHHGTTFLLLAEETDNRVKEIIDYELNTINTDYSIVLYEKTTNSFHYKKPAKYYITPLKIVKKLDYPTIFGMTEDYIRKRLKEE